MTHSLPYQAGCKEAAARLGLQKTAILGRIARLGAKLAPMGTKIEKGITAGATRVLGHHGGQLTGQLVKGMPAEIAKQTAMGAGIGGLLEGGIGAATAEEGQRMSAFGKGFGSGALSGAAFGGIGGAVTAPAKNIRRLSLDQRAKSLGANRTKAVQEQLDRGFFGSAKDAWRGEGPLGRGGALENMAGGLGQTAGEFVLPGIALSALAPSVVGEAPQQPQQYPEALPPQYKTGEALEQRAAPPTSLLTSIAGGATGGLTAGVVSDILKAKGYLPKGIPGTTISRAIPAAGSVTGSLAGYTLGNRMFPEEDHSLAVEEKLDQLDFDKLMRYYKKREGAESQGV